MVHWQVSKRGHRGKANSAPRLGVSLGARAWPRIANLSRLLDASPHILVLYLFSNITPPWRGAARWANLGPSQISNIVISHRTRPRLPAGRFEDPATVKEASSSGSLDRAQHPSSTAPNRRLKILTSRDSLQAEERPPSIFKYIRANCAAMDSPSPLPTQHILCPYVSTDFQLQQALYYTEDAITSGPQTWSLQRKRQRQSPSQGRRSFELGCKR